MDLIVPASPTLVAEPWCRAVRSRVRPLRLHQTTIRVLGGLLSAFHLTSDSMYLKHAVNLADRMLPAFDTPTGLPTSLIHLLSPEEMLTPVNTAEAGTLQLEFRYLAQLTGNAQCWNKAERAIAVINAARIPNRLAPIRLNSDIVPMMGLSPVLNLDLAQTEIRTMNVFASCAPSTGHAFQGGIEPVYLQMYRDVMQEIHDNLIQRTPTSNITYIAEFMPDDYDNWKTSWKLQHRQEHLACFLAGSLMLGAVTTGAVSALVSVPPRAGELSDIGMRNWQNGVDLLEGCMETHKTATELSPEAVEFHVTPNEPGGDWYIKFSTPGIPPPRDAQYVLRPETVESLFIAWRLTGDINIRGRYSPRSKNTAASCRVDMRPSVIINSTRTISALLQQLPSLRELRIHVNNFGIWNPFDALPTDIWLHIKVLRLSFCYLAGNATLGSWLSLFPHLEHLEFRHSVMVPDIVMVSTAGQSREQHLKLLLVDERTLEFVAEWVCLHAVTVDGLVFNDAVTARNLVSLNIIARTIGKDIRRITLGLLLFGPPEDPILVDYGIELRASSLTGYIPATEFSAIINRITSPFIEDILFEV
ncbi:glycoside hydrolase [Mycena rebaudengoi]|nr:glycoside hydrolase [Mycena rebaudengoi]